MIKYVYIDFDYEKEITISDFSERFVDIGVKKILVKFLILIFQCENRRRSIEKVEGKDLYNTIFLLKLVQAIV